MLLSYNFFNFYTGDIFLIKKHNVSVQFKVVSPLIHKDKLTQNKLSKLPQTSRS